MNIDGVSTGIVIDHIKAGKSMEIYKLLNLSELSCSVARPVSISQKLSSLPSLTIFSLGIVFFISS